MERPEADADSPPTADTRRYLVGECVGRGGLGSVYRGWDEHLDRQVAIKRLAAGSPGTASDPATAAARLRREASALAAFQHPHIVTVHDFGADADGPFVVMEFIEGETLEAVAGRAPLDLESFATLAVQSLGAVEAAHRAGLLHRDLKPANLMLTPTSDGAGGFTVKVLDFGLAKFTPHPATQTLDQNQSLLGSIYFMAPEQFHREPLDARTDLYALGAIFYYSLTGRHPFDGDTTAQVMAAHLEGRMLRPLTKLRPDVSPALATWVERLMSRLPADRPASAAAALALARPLLAGVHIPGGARAETGTVPVLLPARGTGAPPSPADAAATPRRWLWPVALGVLLLASVGFFAARTLPLSWSTLSSGAPQAVVATTAPRSAAVLSPPPTAAPSLPPAAPVASPAPAATPSPSPTPATVAPASPTDAAMTASDVAGLRAHLGETVTVTGTPVGVGQSRTGTVFYLNFSPRLHEGLAVVYFTNAGAPFSQEEFRAFVGKPVKARGKLGDFKGDLQLVIQSPADVQVVAATP